MPIPLAEALGLKCPDCGAQLQDAIGPFICPAEDKPVSPWRLAGTVVDLVQAHFGLLTEGPAGE